MCFQTAATGKALQARGKFLPFDPSVSIIEVMSLIWHLLFKVSSVIYSAISNLSIFFQSYSIS